MPHNLTTPMANAARKNPSIAPFWKLGAELPLVRRRISQVRLLSNGVTGGDCVVG
jgi:hypothetical protein